MGHEPANPERIDSLSAVTVEGLRPDPPAKKDKRRHERLKCDGIAEVHLPHAGLRIAGRVADLSIAGCFIEASSVNLERGTLVEILFKANRFCFRVAGNITALRRAGMGIAFLHPSERVQKQICELVQELADASRDSGGQISDQESHDSSALKAKAR